MKQRNTRAFSLILIFTLCLSLLSACSSKNEAEEAYTGGQLAGSDLTGEGGARVFTSKEIALPDAGARATYATKAGDRIFIFAQSEDGKNNYFYFMGADCSITKADIYIPDFIISIDADKDGNAYVLSMGEDKSYILTSASPSMETKSIILNFLSDVGDPICGLYVYENGYLLDAVGKILCYDTEWNFIRELDSLKDGAYYVVKNNSELILASTIKNGMRIEVLDKKFKPSVKYDLPLILKGISAGSADGHIFATNSDITYDIDFTTGNYRGYANSFISGDGTNFIYLSDESYFSIVGGKVKLFSLLSEDESSETKTLTLATYAHEEWAIMDLKEMVRAFNNSGSRYKIDIINYGMYDQEGNNAGLQRLNADIISGNSPDIYDLRCLSYMTLFEKNFLEDLYPWFNNSSGVKREDITESVIRALDYKGKLYNLVPTYAIVTMFGPAEIGSADTWNSDMFLEVANKRSDLNLFGSRITKETYLRCLLAFTGNEYIDEENAKCSFSDSSFAKMLSICPRLPDSAASNDSGSDNWGMIYTGQQLFAFLMNYPEICTGIAKANAAYSGNAEFLGFPSKNSGTALTPLINLGMSASSDGKKGVWSFFEYLLSNEVQDFIRTTPVSKVALNSRIDRTLVQLAECKNVVGFADNKPVEIPMNLDITSIKENSIDCVNYCDEQLYELILSEVKPFFKGDITAEQATENIQNKAMIYMSEKYG